MDENTSTDYRPEVKILDITPKMQIGSKRCEFIETLLKTGKKFRGK